jgi:hypothetical protein
MDCHGKPTVGLCSRPEWLNSVLMPESRLDLKAPHRPNHNMLKVHRILFGRDIARTERNAKDALEAARRTLSEGCIITLLVLRRLHKRVSISHPRLLTRVLCVEEKIVCADCEDRCLAPNEIHEEAHSREGHLEG